MIVLKESKNIEKVRKNMPNYNTITDLSDFFKILGDSTRLQILMALEQSELCVSELSHLLNMTISAISHQLKSLKNAKLVKLRKEGKTVFYSLDDDHINKLLKVSFEHIIEKV
ncbi:MAG: metalloregulator ArsR/SmtB family transcription factor [Firmicutes bacterium]|nr:metalloregulator ArsR/SmtB family transcription factor [Bacillota bacterium]